jgi:FkbM family methyltransferase
MKILYGITVKNSIDVTDICFSKLKINNIINIPSSDFNRAHYFTDPLYGIEKKILILHNDDNITEYDIHKQIKINTIDNSIIVIDKMINEKMINEKITNIHSNLKIKYGNLLEELPEQKMAVRYLTGNEKVLEIGGNIGRNSLIVSSILNDSRNLVALECDINIASQLTENRDLNGFNFHIEKSALSKRQLIQKGWDTIPSDILQEGYSWVNTITIDELKTKYNMQFDTLILDCEGAFYYILMDMPEILNNINLIIMENDYHDISHKNYVDDILLKNGFFTDYRESGGWGPCYNNFFEVWKKVL